MTFNHLIQRLHEFWIRNGDEFAACPGPANASLQRSAALVDLADAFGDGLARQPARPMHQRDSAVAHAKGFIRSRKAARAFIQMRPDRTQLPFQFRQNIHGAVV